MRASLKALSCLAVATAASVSFADSILRQKTLADLTKASTSTFARRNCDFVNVTTDSSGGPVATLNFRGTYASFGQDLTTSQDWSAYNMVQAQVTNKESHAVHFRFIVQLTSDPNNYTGAFTGAFTLDANETQKFIFNLNPDDPAPFGLEFMRPVLSASYQEVMEYAAPRNLKTIFHWRFSNQDSTNASLSISQVKLIRQNLVFDDICDAYGQYTDRGWTAKIHEDSDFATLSSQEVSDIKAHPGPGETTGSNSVTSTVKGTGKWQVVRSSSGQMYLEHPNGKLFWSMGVAGVGEGLATPVNDRATYYQSLPSTTGTYAAAYVDRPTPDGTQRCISFNVKNLITKYGSNYIAPWESRVKSRLGSWGVNTLGIQCNKDFLDGSMPYTVVEDTGDFPVQLKTPYMLWGTLPDPWGVGFQTWMTTKFAADLATDNLNQNFMGVFVDNELSWGNTVSTDRYYNIPRGVLNSASTQPAKTAFMTQLQGTYNNSIKSLNTAWGTTYSSWQSFLDTKFLPKTYTTTMKSDFSKFLTKYANEYYYKVDAALSTAGIKALYLGSRYADFVPEVVTAAAKYVDVYSFNMYRTYDKVDWDYLNSLAKPVMISELGYGANSRGTFGGPSPAYSAQERADRLKAFLDTAIEQQNIVGVHWYSYIDQPITGRWSDYENTGMGLVDVADNPYPESVKALRDFTKTMYSARG